MAFKYDSAHICKSCLRWIEDPERGFHGYCNKKKMLTYMQYGRECDDFRSESKGEWRTP